MNWKSQLFLKTMSYTFMIFFIIGIPVLNCAENPKSSVSFKVKPKLVKKGDGLSINFSVTHTTDVTIAVLDELGVVRRHLVSGMLGDNAPTPLQSSNLSQSVYWDGKSDDGKAVLGQVTVAVKLGVTPVLSRYIGDDKQVLGRDIVSIAVDKQGDLYIMGSEKNWGRSWLKRFDNTGRYKNTIIPFGAHLPQENIKDFHPFKIKGEVIPLVANAHNGSTQNFMSALKEQSMSFDSNGDIIFSSAVGGLSNHGPPMYLLKAQPKGGHPKSGYMGLNLYGPRGFFGGSGEAHTMVYSTTATSHDKKWIYIHTHIPAYGFKKFKVHGIYRVRWNDKSLPKELFLGKKEAGDDNEHFNRPIGITTDKSGNIYVCDNGNNRLMVFNKESKFLQKIKIESPHQVQVHPKNGEIYVLSRSAMKKINRATKNSITKFSPLAKGPIKKIWTLNQSGGKKANGSYGFKHIALDGTKAVAKLWIVEATGYLQADGVFPLIDKGSSFELGKAINKAKGLNFPMYVSADEKGQKLFIKNGLSEYFISVDLKTDEVSKFKLRGTELAVVKSGDILAASGWSVTLNRYSAKGKKIGFPGKPKGLGPWVLGKSYKDGKSDVIARVKGMGLGGRGFAYDTKGNFYMIKMGQYQYGQVDKYSADGILLKEKLIDNLPYGSGGITVDAKGNIYIGISARPMSNEKPYWSYGFDGHVSKEKWVYWRKREGVRKAPWNRIYYNTYMFYWGSLIKFGPEGGKFYSWRTKGHEKEKYGGFLAKKPTDIPKGARYFRTGYLTVANAVVGSKWIYNGIGPIPTSGLNWGDPSCSCWNIRIKSDAYGRVFAPNGFRFSVEMIDTSGNHIQRIGRYDNRDSAERTPKKIGLAWPYSVDFIGEMIYICDFVNGRVVEVKLEYQQKASAKIKM